MSYTPNDAPRGAATPTVVVKLRDPRPLVAAVAPTQPGRRDGEGGDPEAVWSRVRARYPGVTIERALAGVGVEQVARSVQQANRLLPAGTMIPDLTRFYRLRLPANARPAEVADFLQSGDNRGDVDTAYVDVGAMPARIDPTNDPLFARQTYIRGRRGNHRGIYANFAWARPGGDGSGIGLMFVEFGWQLDHEDFAGSGITLLSGINNATNAGNREHGTNCVGEVVGQDNTKGVVGVAPKARPRVVSIERTAGNFSTGAGILAGVLAMSPGDVMSVSLQIGFRPVEVNDLEFWTIRLGTALGRIICIAAGNGNANLDTFTNGAGKFILRRGHADFRDSGAIVVGAATATRPHDKVPASNFGSRVDCFAQGIDVTTTSALASKYIHDFRNTSAATPIVAGAATLTQGMAKARTGSILTVAQIRSALTGPQTSIPSRNPASDRIGRMPNMQLICRYFIDTLKKPAAKGKGLDSTDDAALFVDPGHGGTENTTGSSAYGGAGSYGICEKDVTLALAERVQAHFGGVTRHSRTGDYNVSLGERLELARQSRAPVVVSMHAHSGAASAGPEVWVHRDGASGPGPQAVTLAEAVGDELAAIYGAPVPVREGPLSILDPRRHGRGVAACLVEAGSLAHADDEARLSDSASLDAFGAAIARGVDRYCDTIGAADEHAADEEDTQYEQARGQAADDFAPTADQPLDDTPVPGGLGDADGGIDWEAYR